MNFYKRHIGDYIKKAGHLTLLEHGIYSRLMDVYYTREAGIPEDKAARLIGARSKDEQQALASVLEEFFDLVDGMWIQNRCEEEIAAASAQADANRSNGKKGGRPKGKKTETEPKNNPVGFDSDSEKNLSQTPDSRLQTKTDNDDSTDGGYATPSSSPLPEIEEPPESNDPPIAMAVALRKLGVDATFTHPAVLDWVKREVPPEVLQAAVVLAREQKGPTAKIPPNYLVPIVEKLLNPPQAVSPVAYQPHQSSTPIDIRRPQKPRGLEPKGTDESYDEYQDRIAAAEAARRKAMGA
jgi:uncharacterized protein YdaU (DUF1376 family)